MLERYFVQEVTKIAVTRNAYGDYVENSAGNVTMYCRIRPYVESSRFNSQYEEELNPIMIAWFAPTDNVNTNDIFLYENEYYEVIRVREARAGRKNNVEFLKVSLTKHAMVS